MGVLKQYLHQGDERSHDRYPHYGIAWGDSQYFYYIHILLSISRNYTDSTK
jgi:hypothetical protein